MSAPGFECPRHRVATLANFEGRRASAARWIASSVSLGTRGVTRDSSCVGAADHERRRRSAYAEQDSCIAEQNRRNTRAD